MSTTPARKIGRPTGTTDTRAKILVAASELFGDKGYEATTIRAVAEQAEVDPALVMHYFKNKPGLFDATVAELATLIGAFDNLATVRDFAAAYFSSWEDPILGPRLKAIARAGTGSDHAAKILANFISTNVLTAVTSTPFGAALGKESLTRLPYAAASMLGIAIARYVVKAPLMATLSTEELVDAVTPGLEAILQSPRQ